MAEVKNKKALNALQKIRERVKPVESSAGAPIMQEATEEEYQGGSPQKTI
jgi:hypothetical protein